VIRRVLQWTATVVLIIYVIWLLVDSREIFSERFSGTLWHAGLLTFGIGCTWIVNSLQTLLPLRELGVRVGFWENLLLTVAVVFGNYLPMRAGSLLRLEYIRAIHGMGYLRYGGILGARALMLLWAAGGVGLAGGVVMAVAGHEIRPEVFLLFGVVLGAGLLPFIVPVQRLLPNHGLAQRVGTQVTDAIELVRRNRRMGVWYFVLVLVQLAILTMRLAVSFDVIQRQPPAWVYCFLSPIATILAFINITPGNLGLREWVVGILSAGVGIDYAEGIFAASIDRAMLMLMTLTIGGLAAAIVVTRLGRGRARAHVASS
jgi:hypothetical protein